MTRRSALPDETQAVIASFLEAHYSRTHFNDVGPTLGLLALLRNEAPSDKTAQRQLNAAVSLALTGHATGIVH